MVSYARHVDCVLLPCLMHRLHLAVVLQQFLQNTATQLTFPGLFALNALEPGSVVAVSRAL